MQKITPFLWFDTQAEDAANLYVDVFSSRSRGGESKILGVSRYGEGAPRPAGEVMTVSFMIDGHEFTALNAGPDFTFSPAISFHVACESQEEVDGLWEALTEGGSEEPCGWLRDKFGLSWQIIPTVLIELMNDPDREKADRVTNAMLQMSKIDIAELQRAAEAV
ncbi:MAG: VOC family protein [Actinomycetota bacterium]